MVMKTGILATAAMAALLSATGGAHDFSSGFTTEANALHQVREGRETFRFATFGDEAFWGDGIGLHLAIAGADNGGVGPGVSPKAALAAGLKVDVNALPRTLQRALARGQVNLDSPATTVALLKLDAVVGVTGIFDESGKLSSMGIQCAFCHSTVDNSFAPGIGKRMDGWANTTLNPGAIIALSPALTSAQKAVYNSWGPGRYDPRFNFDGVSTPLVLPPAYGLMGVDKETFTAEGPVSYWNAYVAVTQMHGQGNFSDPRLGIDIVHTPDLVTPKLPALRE